MPQEIKADPAVLRNKADALNIIYSNMTASIGKLDSYINNIQNAWEGDVAATYIDEYKQARAGFEARATKVESYSKHLINTAAEWEQRNTSSNTETATMVDL